jgi:DNA-binding transcriptional ArsR family regulator
MEVGLADPALEVMATKAGEAAVLLKALANEQRLLILCHLVSAGELPAGVLVERVGLGQSALSQHLARLREEGLVTFRREAQSLVYRIADPRAEQMLGLLRDLFCPELKGAVDDRPSGAGHVAR